jgi:hypothetical protein
MRMQAHDIALNRKHILHYANPLMSNNDLIQRAIAINPLFAGVPDTINDD